MRFYVMWRRINTKIIQSRVLMSSFSPKLLSVSKVLVAVSLLCITQVGSAETLLDVYRDAVKHDPSFAKTEAEWDIAVAD